jgi:hypothetical protein
MELINRLNAKIKHWIRKQPVVHIISDSHGEAFEYLNWTKLNINPIYCIVQGATASGLANPNSKTKALPIFLNHIKKRIKKIDRIIFQLGEIDCGFTIWLRAEKKGIPIEEQLKITIDNYSKLLTEAQNRVLNPIIITSAILPTIEDGQDFGEIANLRKEVKATQLERTQLTLKFNQLIKDVCMQNDYTFIDLDLYILNKNTSLVKKEYKNNNKLDHHLAPKKLAILLNQKLSELLV